MTTKNLVALIIGVTGQDGSYLAKSLLDKGFTVFGTSRDEFTANKSNLKILGIDNKIKIHSCDIKNFRSVLITLEKTNPDYLFHLAGQTSVGLSFSLPYESIESILISTLHILEAVKFFNNKIRIFLPCSSDCFGASTNEMPSNEKSVHSPKSPYAVAKSSSYWLAMTYKQSYGMFISVGFLSNHESPLRGKHFVTTKIFNGIRQILNNEKKTITLGNLNIFRDWGWAPSYVEAIFKIINADEPDNYIVATGKTFSLQYIVERAFELQGLGPASKYLIINKSDFRPNEIKKSFLDPSKINNKLNWKPDINLDKMIIKLLKQEYY